jgi:ribosome biogenesis GTPase / thiamine phosphate phosphatase
MKLHDLGLTDQISEQIKDLDLSQFSAGRVTREHRERYIVSDGEKEYEAEVTGNLRFTATSRADFPAVGDWVIFQVYNSDQAIIHRILHRKSILSRQVIDEAGEIQPIAANIDYAFLVQAADRDFNINRLERYLTICNSSRVEPVIIITKTDLITSESIASIVAMITSRITKTPVIAISNSTQDGYETLTKILRKGKTYCFLGSSGVGKSTLINNLTGKALMKTDSISKSTNKGRHVTSHRELFVLENGAILIDNPGMREVGITDTTDGLELTFDIITRLAPKCKYIDCTHTEEAGCAVREAVENGELDSHSYENYLKMLKEKAHFESSVIERREKDKTFGKMMKNYKKDKKKNEL